MPCVKGMSSAIACYTEVTSTNKGGGLDIQHRNKIAQMQFYSICLHINNQKDNMSKISFHKLI